jgi:hypothetical protein
VIKVEAICKRLYRLSPCFTTDYLCVLRYRLLRRASSQ